MSALPVAHGLGMTLAVVGLKAGAEIALQNHWPFTGESGFALFRQNLKNPNQPGLWKSYLGMTLVEGFLFGGLAFGAARWIT